VHRVRGNVNSRLNRLDAGEFDALVLARAGLARIGYEDRAAETFDTDAMCPAVGAGVIGLQCRIDDRDGPCRPTCPASSSSSTTSPASMARSYATGN
jgi:porphobilinogen deaminase